MSYGKMIREWREKKALTQREVAQLVGYTDGYIAHIEGEMKIPSLDICIALAAALEVTQAEEQELYQAVEEARRRRAEKRIRTRGSVVGSAMRMRGMAPKPPDAELTLEDIANDLSDDPDLRTAYHYLKIAFADPQMRETILNTLRSFAQTSEERIR